MNERFLDVALWSTLLGMFLSLVFGFFPAARDWFYTAKSDEFRASFMLLGNLLIGVALGLLNNFDLYEIFFIWLASSTGNTVTFSSTKRLVKRS